MYFKYFKVIYFYLKNKRDEDWIVLYEYFSALRPLASQLEADKRIIHYLERIFYVANRSSFQNESTLKLIDLLTQMFPKVIEIICVLFSIRTSLSNV